MTTLLPMVYIKTNTLHPSKLKINNMMPMLESILTHHHQQQHDHDHYHHLRSGKTLRIATPS